MLQVCVRRGLDVRGAVVNALSKVMYQARMSLEARSFSRFDRARAMRVRPRVAYAAVPGYAVLD